MQTYGSTLEHPELEGTLKDHRAQLPAPHSTTQNPNRTPKSAVQTLLELWGRAHRRLVKVHRDARQSPCKGQQTLPSGPPQGSGAARRRPPLLSCPGPAGSAFVSALAGGAAPPPSRSLPCYSSRRPFAFASHRLGCAAMENGGVYNETTEPQAKLPLRRRCGCTLRHLRGWRLAHKALQPVSALGARRGGTGRAPFSPPG